MISRHLEIMNDKRIRASETIRFSILSFLFISRAFRAYPPRSEENTGHSFFSFFFSPQAAHFARIHQGAKKNTGLDSSINKALILTVQNRWRSTLQPYTKELEKFICETEQHKSSDCKWEVCERQMNALGHAIYTLKSLNLFPGITKVKSQHNDANLFPGICEFVSEKVNLFPGICLRAV